MMKRLSMALLMIAALAISCTKEEPLMREEPQDVPVYNYSFNASATDDPDTRISFDPDAKSFAWNKGDQVMVLFSSSDNGNAQNDYRIFQYDGWPSDTYLPFTAVQDGVKTTFKVEESNMNLSKDMSYNYKAVHPFPQVLKNENQPIAYTVPATQNGQFNSADCLMYAFVENAPALGDGPTNNDPTFTFKHLLTFLSFSIQDPDKIAEEDFQIYGFEMEFPTPVAGELTISPQIKEDKDLPLTLVKADNKLRIVLADPVRPADRYSADNAAIITCLPFTIEAGQHFTVNILARSAQHANIRQTVICAPRSTMDCQAGHFRKIALQLNADDLVKTNEVTPVGGTSIQQLLGNPDFAPVADDSNYRDIYGRNAYGYFCLAGQVMTSGSRVWKVGNETTNQSDNVIILDNTITGRNSSSLTKYQSAFYMPVETVLPEFYEMNYVKDIEVSFKAYVLMSGTNQSPSVKVEAPVWIALNHCDTSTSRGGDSGCAPIEKLVIPVGNVHYSADDVPTKGYPAVPAQPGWVEYKTTITSEHLPLTQFMPNSNGTPAYIGFKIEPYGDTVPRMLIYIKDVAYKVVNRTKKPSNNWMAHVAGTTRLSDLSIPGTHDAATGYLSNGSKRCQHLNLKEQLQIGVRALDLRPSASQDLMIYHSTTSTGITFAKAIDAVADFLKANDTETVIVMMKNESGSSEDWKTHMGAYLQQHRDREVTPGKKLFADFRQNMTLDDARGQILLLSRDVYDGPVTGAMIDSGQWGNGTNNSQTTIANGAESAVLFIQDNYWATTTFDQKTKAIQDMNRLSRTDTQHNWYFNYVSIAGSSPMENAVVLNEKTIFHLQANPGKTGILWMDFAGQAYSKGDHLVRTIIEQN